MEGIGNTIGIDIVANIIIIAITDLDILDVLALICQGQSSTSTYIVATTAVGVRVSVHGEEGGRMRSGDDCQ